MPECWIAKWCALFLKFALPIKEKRKEDSPVLAEDQVFAREMIDKTRDLHSLRGWDGGQSARAPATPGLLREHKTANSLTVPYWTEGRCEAYYWIQEGCVSVAVCVCKLRGKGFTSDPWNWTSATLCRLWDDTEKNVKNYIMPYVVVIIQNILNKKLTSALILTLTVLLQLPAVEM